MNLFRRVRGSGDGRHESVLPPRVEQTFAPVGRRFEGKVAVVTGASAGIGLCAALAFAREGAKVALLARREAEGGQALEQVKAKGVDAAYIRTDVGDATQVRAAFRRIREQFGRVDVAFNNAGVQQKMGRVLDVEDAEFDRLMQVNVKGMWWCMREEVALMEDRGGAIVNMSSIRAQFPGAHFGVYAASKAAVLALTRSAALDYAENHVRVNAVCPGFVRTDMTRGVEEPWLKKRVPTERWIEPEEVAEAVLFLCSDAAAGIDGEAMVIDGGVTMRLW